MRNHCSIWTKPRVEASRLSGDIDSRSQSSFTSFYALQTRPRESERVYRLCLLPKPGVDLITDMRQSVSRRQGWAHRLTPTSCSILYFHWQMRQVAFLPSFSALHRCRRGRGVIGCGINSMSPNVPLSHPLYFVVAEWSPRNFTGDQCHTRLS